MQEPEYRPMQRVKRHFFAMRNGVIADALRKAGSPFRFIFGLNLPQLIETRDMIGKDAALAEELWANTSTRESMLLAPMIMPVESFTKEDAYRWVAMVTSAEVADIFCHRLLRNCSFAPDLAVDLAAENRSDMERYCAGRLAINILNNDVACGKRVAKLLDGATGSMVISISRQLNDHLLLIQE